jgi:Flp pilus assembly protein TadB
MTSLEESKGENQKLAFEEYELYYKTTEKVTEWRLAINRWNYSICTAVLIAFAAILNWATSNPGFLAVALLGVALLCAMGVLFCTLWVGQIQTYKNLNNAKFKVLNDMAHHIAFSSSRSDERVSYSPFEKEWKILEEQERALEELANTQIMALKSSNIEYLIPKAFRLLFGFVLIVTVVLVIANWNLIVTSSSFVIQVTPTAVPTLTATP